MQTDEQKVVNLKGFLPFLNTEKKEKALSLIEDMIRIRAYYFWEKTGENAKFCWEQASEKFPTYNERFEFFETLGFIPIGKGGIWSDGKEQITIYFFPEETTIKI